jgi:hypothetical protein
MGEADVARGAETAVRMSMTRALGYRRAISPVESFDPSLTTIRSTSGYVSADNDARHSSMVSAAL